MSDVEKIKDFYPPADIEHLARINRSLSGRDEEVAKKIKTLDGYGIGRTIVSLNEHNQFDRKIIGISLPTENTREDRPLHVLALDDGSIYALKPDVPENKIRHVILFGRREEPLEGVWSSGAAFSWVLEQNPEKYYSKVTHSIFEPDKRDEVKELLSEAIENAFILRENKIDGLEEGRNFIRESFTVFEPKKGPKTS